MAKEIDLDFSEITGKPTVVTEPAKAAAPKEPAKPKPIADIAIALGGGEYIFKDVADCTGAEFLAFAYRVFPLKEGSVQAKDFDTREARARAFEQIRRYHENGLFNARKGEKSLVN